MKKTTVRIYGSHKEIAKRYYEIQYKDYSIEDGSLVATGSEDFTSERWHKELQVRRICTWHGEYNKGGYKKWEDHGYHWVRRSEKKELRQWASIKFGGTLQIR